VVKRWSAVLSLNTHIKFVRDLLGWRRSFRLPPGPDVGPKDELVRVKKLIQYGYKLKKTYPTPTKDTLPICTVFLEIVDISDPPMTGVSLVPRHEVPQDVEFQVAYDRTYPCSETSRSMIAYLYSNHSFHLVNDRGLDHRYMMSMFMTFEIPSHTLRILPIDDDRPPFPALPPETLRIILSQAALASDHWRSTLLSYGLVCQTWAQALNVFYSIYCGEKDKPSVVSVARSLSYNPENARLIPRFDPCDYRGVEDNLDSKGVPDDEFLRESQALLEILELTTNVQKIQIRPVHRTLLPQFIRLLYRMKRVKECRIPGDSAFNREKNLARGYVSIENTLFLMVLWSNLINLEVEHTISDEQK
jgi:hypothetical protein